MLNEIYLGCPAFVQNLALSLYGAKMHRDRFGGEIPEIYQHLASPFIAPTATHYQLQQTRLTALLDHCANYVPYYQRIFKDCNWKAVNAENIGELLPKLTKKDIIADPHAFLSTAPQFQDKLLQLNTSGSSGTPLKILSSYEARRLNYHFYERLLKECGSTYRAKSTTFAGRILYKENSKTFDRYDKFNNTQYLSTYFISSSTIKKYIDALNRWQPEFIDAYPSALTEIVQLARQQELRILFRPKFILTSSETLSPQARTQIETFFNSKVIDHYGCTEMTVSAFSNGGPYYASPLYSVLEAVQQGDQGYSLITTGLLNFAMPLVRYEIGDCISTNNPQTPYVFDGVEGRLDDVIVTPEGRRVGRIDPAFKGIEGVEMAQVIQDTINQITVKIVLNEQQRNSFNEILLIENLKQRTSPLMDIRITYHQKIEKGANGKFKSVVSNIR